MRRQDPRGDDEAPGAEVEMIDAPPDTPPRPPRKLEIRSRTGRSQEEVQGVARAPAYRAYRRSIYEAYEKEEHYGPALPPRDGYSVPGAYTQGPIKHHCDVETDIDGLDDPRLKDCDDALNEERRRRPDAEHDVTQLQVEIELLRKELLERDSKDDNLMGPGKVDREDWETEKRAWQDERDKWQSQKQKYEDRLKLSEAELKRTKAKWKQMGKELNVLRAQGQGFYQVTDDYLEGMIMRLRYNIRSFAIQYFSAELPRDVKFAQGDRDTLWETCMESTTAGSERYLDYLACAERRPSVVQAFLWNVLYRKILESFRWAGATSIPMTEIYEDLRQGLRDIPTSAARIEAIKRLHTWRATTVGLLLNSMSPNQQDHAKSQLQKMKDKLFAEIDPIFSQLQAEYQEDYREAFFDIIDEAIKVDMEISKQVSSVTWVFAGQEDTTFDPAEMELEDGGIPNEDNLGVVLTTCPGVRKRGRSNGEGFETGIWLVKMEVSCAARKKTTKGR